MQNTGGGVKKVQRSKWPRVLSAIISCALRRVADTTKLMNCCCLRHLLSRTHFVSMHELV